MVKGRRKYEIDEKYWDNDAIIRRIFKKHLLENGIYVPDNRERYVYTARYLAKIKHKIEGIAPSEIIDNFKRAEIDLVGLSNNILIIGEIKTRLFPRLIRKSHRKLEIQKTLFSLMIRYHFADPYDALAAIKELLLDTGFRRYIDRNQDKPNSAAELYKSLLLYELIINKVNIRKDGWIETLINRIDDPNSLKILLLVLAHYTIKLVPEALNYLKESVEKLSLFFRKNHHAKIYPVIYLIRPDNVSHVPKMIELIPISNSLTDYEITDKKIFKKEIKIEVNSLNVKPCSSCQYQNICRKALTTFSAWKTIIINNDNKQEN